MLYLAHTAQMHFIFRLKLVFLMAEQFLLDLCLAHTERTVAPTETNLSERIVGAAAETETCCYVRPHFCRQPPPLNFMSENSTTLVHCNSSTYTLVAVPVRAQLEKGQNNCAQWLRALAIETHDKRQAQRTANILPFKRFFNETKNVRHFCARAFN